MRRSKPSSSVSSNALWAQLSWCALSIFPPSTIKKNPFSFFFNFFKAFVIISSKSGVVLLFLSSTYFKWDLLNNPNAYSSSSSGFQDSKSALFKKTCPPVFCFHSSIKSPSNLRGIFWSCDYKKKKKKRNYSSCLLPISILIGFVCLEVRSTSSEY